MEEAAVDDSRECLQDSGEGNKKNGVSEFKLNVKKDCIKSSNAAQENGLDSMETEHNTNIEENDETQENSEITDLNVSKSVNGSETGEKEPSEMDTNDVSTEIMDTDKVGECSSTSTSLNADNSDNSKDSTNDSSKVQKAVIDSNTESNEKVSAEDDKMDVSEEKESSNDEENIINKDLPGGEVEEVNLVELTENDDNSLSASQEDTNSDENRVDKDQDDENKDDEHQNNENKTVKNQYDENEDDDDQDDENKDDDDQDDENKDDDDQDDEDQDDEDQDDGAVKIKLRSFASLCSDDDIKKGKVINNNNSDCLPLPNSFEINGVSVGDIVQHSSMVASDESGVMHLKISKVVGGEDCITGLIMNEEDAHSAVQISSATSLMEPLSPDLVQDKDDSSDSPLNQIGLRIVQLESLSGQSVTPETDGSKKLHTIVNILKSPLVVENRCVSCKKKCVCTFRVVYKPKSEIRTPFICSEKCKEKFSSSLPDNSVLEKPRRYFEKLCGMCGKDVASLSKDEVLTWQTRDFCNKLCLADHIGEVARTCHSCLGPVRVLYMVKYCVRFGSSVHQFCSNVCLESYKSSIEVCCYCQKNLKSIQKVISPASKEYCSSKCLKRAQRRDVGQQNYGEENDCTVCKKNKVNKYEFANNNTTAWLCSDPCLSVYKYVNHVKSVNCCLCERLLNAEDFPTYFFNSNQLRVFCSGSCLSVFIISARKIVSCNYCKVKKYNYDMISQHKGTEDLFYCSVCCLNLVDGVGKTSNQVALPGTAEISTSNSILKPADCISTISKEESTALPLVKECNMCSKTMPPQFHMVMSDSTLRSFCSYICATRYKCTFGYQVSCGQSLVERKAEANAQIECSKNVTKKVNEIAVTEEAKESDKPDNKDLVNLLRMFDPPTLCNKSTACKPHAISKAIQCKPHQWHKEIQTDDDGKPVFVSVPYPIFIPVPMMMYSAKVPMPLIIPLPVPVPIFIPTTEKTTEDIVKRMKKVMEEMPSDPAEAELLLLARDEAQKSMDEEKTTESDDKDDGKLPEQVPKTELFIEDEQELLLTLDANIPKFTYNEDSSATQNYTRGKRRRSDVDCNEDQNSSKRMRPGEDEEQFENSDYLNTSFGLIVWRQWVQKKNSELQAKSSSATLLEEDLLQNGPEMANQSLSMFLNELRAPDGKPYEIDTVFYLLLGLQKDLFMRGSTHCIFLEERFEKFTSVFDKIIRTSVGQMLESDIACFERLQGSRVMEEMLWESRQLGAHTPHVLLNTLFYFNTKVFKLKTVQQHLDMSFSHIVKQWRRTNVAGEASYTRTTLLKFFPKKHTDCEDLKTDDQSLDMHENKTNPLRCPVKLYEFYLSKCPESVRSQQGIYYVYPEQCCLPDSPVWFTTIPLAENTVQRMLNRMLLVKDVQDSLFH